MIKQIYLFTEKIKADTYGIGTYIEQLSNCFSTENGIKLNIINLRSNRKEFYREDKNGINYFYIPKVFDFDSQDFYYRNVFYLIHPYISPQSNIIFHFNLVEQIVLVDYISKYFTTAKFCITIHFFNWSFLLNGDIERLELILKKQQSQQELSDFEQKIIRTVNNEITFLKKINSIICLSEYAQRCIKTLYHISIESSIKINNGIIPVFPSKKRDEIKKDMFISPTDTVVTFIGRLYESKGINILLEAFEILLKKYVHVKLIVVGDGNITSYINKCFPFLNKTLFTGYISKEQLELIYSMTDIGVLPSYHEQCSFVAIEMMAHKIPIVYTNTLGLNEMLSHEMNISLKRDETGRLFQDPKELAEKLLFLCKNEGFRNKLSLISLEAYKEKYTLKKMKEEYISFYNRLYNS